MGSLKVDCSALADFLVDLPPRAMMGMRSEQPGYDEVVNEIRANQASWGVEAGILEQDVAALALADEHLAQIDAQLPAVKKLMEILTETRAQIDDQRQRSISIMAQSIESRTRRSGSDELLARYEKTRTYRSAIGHRAARTRRRNAQRADTPAEANVQADSAS